MGYGMWEHVAALKARLDETQKDPGSDANLTIRALKLAEEAGEVANAVINAQGQNPRKPAEPWSHAADEACDAIITAAILLASILPGTPAAQGYLEKRMAERRVRLEAAIAASRAQAEPELALFELPIGA
jgi:NTP pyrophosphatase (non-canonical NTP hydrolase)